MKCSTCSCESEPGFKRCLKCRESRRKSAAKWRVQRKKSSGCAHCNQPAVEGMSLCEKHSQQHRDKKQKYQRTRMLKKYCLTESQYKDMYVRQECKCLICGVSRGLAGYGVNVHDVLVVDHNHTTGEVRGLLCSRCNLILGNIEQAGDLLPTMINYLEKPRV